MKRTRELYVVRNEKDKDEKSLGRTVYTCSVEIFDAEKRARRVFRNLGGRKEGYSFGIESIEIVKSASVSDWRKDRSKIPLDN